MTEPAAPKQPEALRKSLHDESKETVQKTPKESRRAVMAGGLAGAAALVSAKFARAAPRVVPAMPRVNTTVDPIYRLLKRTRYGFTYADYQAAASAGFTSYLDSQIDYTNLTAPPIAQLFPATKFSAAKLYSCSQDPNDPDYPCNPVGSLQGATLTRMAQSEQSLYERMVEFWVDHFNINIQEDGRQRYLTPVSNRQVMRRGAMLDFKALLKATARDPAMLNYLDNGVSQCPVPNENYAREIMELHAMGTAPQQYTEQDVQELARILSGWSFQLSTMPNPGEPAFGIYWFKGPPSYPLPSWHCTGPKMLFGRTIENVNIPEREGDTALKYIADHPSTKDFISKKFTSWWLTDNPPQSVIDAVKVAFPSIPNMIRAVLSIANFDAACVDQNPKYLRPSGYVAGLLRATGADFLSGANGLRALNAELDKLGQVLHEFGPPTGYPDSIFAWGQAQQVRWSFAIRLLRNQITDVTVNIPQVFASVGGYSQANAGQLVNLILCSGNMDPAEVSAIQRVALTYPANPTDDQLGDLIALGAMGTSFNEI